MNHSGLFLGLSSNFPAFQRVTRPCTDFQVYLRRVDEQTSISLRGFTYQQLIPEQKVGGFSFKRGCHYLCSTLFPLVQYVLAFFLHRAPVRRLVPSHLRAIVFSGVNVPESPPIKSDRSFGNILFTALSASVAATILALLLEATSHSDVPLAEIARHFLDSFVYSNCIGVLVGFAVLTQTPRLAVQRFPLSWALLICMIVSLAFVGSLLAGFTLMVIGAFPPRDYTWIALDRMGFGVLLALVFGISAYLYESIRLRLRSTTHQLHTKALEGERAQKLAVEARLSSLESRIRPHFLFNTLNSISSLIHEDPLLAELVLERLAALLRFSLDASNRGTIPLEQEIQITLDYLEIQKARFGERLHYYVTIPAELNTAALPPFVIQTLVENSVKHVISLRGKGGKIHIEGKAVDDKLNIEVRDNGAGFTSEAITVGHGLDNLRTRLALFDKESALDISREGGFTVVSVSLPKRQP